MMETEVSPRIIKTSKDAIPLETTGIIEAVGGIKIVPMIEGIGIETEMKEVDTLNSAYNEKKYAEILLHYRQLFVEANVFIAE